MNVWRERLGRWFAGAAAVYPWSPNSITLAALLLNLAAAVSMYLAAERPVLFLVAVGLLAVGGLADAFDGIVARVQQKQSQFGDFLDHFCDRASDLALTAGWMLGSHVDTPLMAAAMIAVMLNGYAGTQIEATWQRREYETVGRGEFVLAMVVFPIVSFILGTNGWSDQQFSALTTAEWLSVLLIAFALFGIVQRFRVARTLERGP